MKDNWIPGLCQALSGDRSQSRFECDERLRGSNKSVVNKSVKGEKNSVIVSALIWNHWLANSKESRNYLRIVVWIFASVAKSMLLVASSSIMILFRRRSARAIAISCRCPCEKFFPPADTWVSNETVVFASISVTEVAIEAAALSLSTPWIDGALDATREFRWEVWPLSVSICTRRRTSTHSLSSCSSSRMSAFHQCVGCMQNLTERIQILSQSAGKQCCVLRDITIEKV